MHSYCALKTHLIHKLLGIKKLCDIHSFTRLPTLFPMMISASMTHWLNLLTIILVPLHKPIDWLRLRNKRIGTPTLSSNLWFVIPSYCKVFINSTGYNESIETLVATLAPSSVRAKESALRYVCNPSDSDSNFFWLHQHQYFWGLKCYIA